MLRVVMQPRFEDQRDVWVIDTDDVFIHLLDYHKVGSRHVLFISLSCSKVENDAIVLKEAVEGTRRTDSVSYLGPIGIFQHSLG